MNLLATAFAFFLGGLLALQVVVNSQAKIRLKVDGESINALQAALVNFGGGTIVLIAVCLIGRFTWPSFGVMRSSPWWIWTGGILGIVYVAASTVLGHRLGVTLFLTLVVAGQVISSLVIDEIGFAGAAVKPVNLGRLAGAALVLVGVVLVARSTDVAAAAAVGDLSAESSEKRSGEPLRP